MREWLYPMDSIIAVTFRGEKKGEFKKYLFQPMVPGPPCDAYCFLNNTDRLPSSLLYVQASVLGHVGHIAWVS